MSPDFWAMYPRHSAADRSSDRAGEAKSATASRKRPDMTLATPRSPRNSALPRTVGSPLASRFSTPMASYPSSEPTRKRASAKRAWTLPGLCSATSREAAATSLA